jgi:hypothetical protein
LYDLIGDSFQLPLESDFYNVGVALKNKDSTNTVNATLSFTSTYCVNTVGADCKTPISPINTSVTSTITVTDTPSYFSYEVVHGSLYKNFTVSFTPTTTDPTAAVYNIAARYRGVPNPGAPDTIIAVGTSLTVIAPIHGTYLISVSTTGNVPSNLTTQTGSCPSNKTGPNCDVDFTDVKAGLWEQFGQSEKIPDSGFKYYYVSNSTENSLLVSLKPVTDKSKFPTIYASWNRVPSVIEGKVVGADVIGCNQGADKCKYASIISLSQGLSPSPNDTTGTWYIVVSGEAKFEYQIWFSFACPNNCNGQGKCSSDASADSYGKCECNSNFQGVTCADDNMF